MDQNFTEEMLIRIDRKFLEINDKFESVLQQNNELILLNKELTRKLEKVELSSIIANPIMYDEQSRSEAKQKLQSILDEEAQHLSNVSSFSDSSRLEANIIK